VLLQNIISLNIVHGLNPLGSLTLEPSACSMEDDLQQFLEIERKRKLMVERSIQELINRRKILNEKMQQELQAIMDDTYAAQEYTNVKAPIIEHTGKQQPTRNEAQNTVERQPVIHPGAEVAPVRESERHQAPPNTLQYTRLRLFH
ncbi:hypothetical protein THOM_0602, partial [Trachipleistophora hominis]